uniref:Uncharacterized protein n=1 Tax=Ignisphaera aggregans TaxID=334771 RepID=A0A7J2T9U7_9CREN
MALAAKNVIEAARKVVGNVKEEFTVPSDPVECIRLLIERAANTFLGVGEGGKYTLFAWTLRKITREYFEAMYSTLAKDEEKKRAVFEILGVKELFKPAIKSPLSDNLTILGYPDYPTYGTVVEWGSRVKVKNTTCTRTDIGRHHKQTCRHYCYCPQ